VRQSDALQQLLEAGIGFKTVNARIGIQENKSALAATIRTFQHFKSAIDISQRDIDVCPLVRQNTTRA